MHKCIYLRMHESRRQRLIGIVRYLEKGNNPSFEELSDYLAEQYGPIKTRQLRLDIKWLREEGLNGQPLNIKMKGFRYYLVNEKQFDYSNLLENEKVTLPLVFAALHPFERFPAVRAILDNLIEVHRLNRQEIRQLGAAIGQHLAPMNELFVDRIISIMQAIHLEQAVEFNYYKVDQGAISEDNEIVYRCVYPLQIRVFEGRYYLVGLRTEKEPLGANVEHFPIDRMHRRVDLAIDVASEKPIKFNWADLAQDVDFDHLFAYRIGMYRGYGDHSEPQYVYRWFKGWAASFVQAVPLHSSQEIVQQNGGEIRIRIFVVPTPDLENVFRKYGEYSWSD